MLSFTESTLSNILSCIQEMKVRLRLGSHEGGKSHKKNVLQEIKVKFFQTIVVSIMDVKAQQ